jgi:hypothetical protein
VDLQNEKWRYLFICSPFKLITMKKISLILFPIVFLFACNQGSNKNESNENTTDNHVETSELTLNNGAKWQADSSTNRHLISLKTTANMFKVNPLPPVEEYRILGSDLKAGLDSMIRDCKLTGPAHEVLHKWLEPVLRQTNELKNVSDTTTAKSVFDSLDKRINIYYDYFQ